jgi:hypothetical protein
MSTIYYDEYEFFKDIFIIMICLSISKLLPPIGRNGDTVSSLNYQVLSPLGQQSKDEDHSDNEILVFMQLEEENDYLTASVGEVARIPGHFVYFVDGRRRDER